MKTFIIFVCLARLLVLASKGTAFDMTSRRRDKGLNVLLLTFSLLTLAASASAQTNYEGSINASGSIVSYNGVGTVDQGVPPIYASAHALAQAAAIGATTLYTPSTTNGIYRVSGCVCVTTAGTGTNQPALVFQGAGNGAATTVPFLVQNITGTMQVTNSVPLTAVAQFSLLPMIIQSTNAVIQYKTTSNIGGSAKYDLHLSLEALNSK